MSLDLEKIALPIQEFAQQLKSGENETRQRLEKAVSEVYALDPQDVAALKQKIESCRTRVRWPAAGLSDSISRNYPLPSLPQNFAVLAVDGSHIEIDRHRAAQFYLINLGQVSLHYGDTPGAVLSNKAFLYGNDKDDSSQDDMDSETGGGELLSARSSVEECRLLATMLEELSGAEPVLALLDGTLILWGLGRQTPQVRQSLVQKGIIPALDKMKTVSGRRQIALASYVSSPRSTDVVNALRIKLCSHQSPDCKQYCFTREATQECQTVSGLMDKDMFSRFLAPGERSPLFFSPSSVVRSYYGEHQVVFFYVNVGQEIARVEMPSWTAEKPSLVDLAHVLIHDQCRRGLGYPVALGEAHQQAVVTIADRDNFWRLVERTLEDSSLSAAGSPKSQSKQTRWL